MKEERTQCFSETILEENKARGFVLSGVGLIWKF